MLRGRGWVGWVGEKVSKIRLSLASTAASLFGALACVPPVNLMSQVLRQSRRCQNMSTNACRCHGVHDSTAMEARLSGVRACALRVGLHVHCFCISALDRCVHQPSSRQTRFWLATSAVLLACWCHTSASDLQIIPPSNHTLLTRLVLGRPASGKHGTGRHNLYTHVYGR